MNALFNRRASLNYTPIDRTLDATRSCIVIPTYPPHFEYAVRLATTIHEFNTGRNYPKLVIVDDEKQIGELKRNHSTELFDLIIPLTKLLSTTLNVPDVMNGKQSYISTHKIYGKRPPSTTWSRRYQILKKWLGTVESRKAFNCTLAWVVDSESFLFRNFNLTRMFERYAKTPWISTWGASAKQLTQYHLFFGTSPRVWPAAMGRTYYEDFWIYDTHSLSEMIKFIQNLHYPRSFENLILSFEYGVHGEYHYYGNWLLMNKHLFPTSYFSNFNTVDIRDLLPLRMSTDYRGRTMSGFILDLLKNNTRQDVSRRVARAMNEAGWFNFLGWRDSLWSVVDQLCKNGWIGGICLSNCKWVYVHDHAMACNISQSSLKKIDKFVDYV